MPSPDKAQCTGDDKCHLPAVHYDAHTTSGGAIIAPIEEPTLKYLLRWNALSPGTIRSWLSDPRDHRCFRGTDRTTSNSQATPLPASAVAPQNTAHSTANIAYRFSYPAHPVHNLLPVA